MDNIINQIKTLIQQKSDEYRKNDPGQYDFWNGHLKYVYREATQLAENYGADLEIVQLGALLHDIAQIELGEICVADADILAHFDNIPMLFDAAYNLHKMVGLENVRNYMRETFEKDFDDLSERTKAEFEPKYCTIYEVVLGTEG